MQSAAQSYASMAQKTGNPRELEAQLLLRAAAKMKVVSEDAAASREQIIDAIRYNRRLWTVFADTVSKSENPLPDVIKQNITSLALFIMRQSIAAEAEPNAQRLAVLISINREIAAGLAASAAAAEAPTVKADAA
jgi:flagellar protein FlaF